MSFKRRGGTIEGVGHMREEHLLAVERWTCVGGARRMIMGIKRKWECCCLRLSIETLVVVLGSV